MSDYEEENDDIFTGINRIRGEYPENDDKYTLSEFAKRLLCNPDGAYEHVCECCLRLERIELYEVVKALALGISNSETERGRSAFRIAGSYLLDDIRIGLPHDEADNCSFSEYNDDDYAFDDFADKDCLDDSFARFKSLFERTI